MRYLLAVLALAGVVVSVLALRVHFSTETQSCSINEHWDCGVVNHSEFAEVAHLPVAVLGIAGYLGLGALALLRKKYLFLLLVIAGCVFALRLTLIEDLVLEAWCIYCVISQSIIGVMTLLGLGWFTAEYRALRRDRA